MPVSKSMQPSECSINAPEVEIVIHWLVAFLLLAVLAPTAVPGKNPNLLLIYQNLRDIFFLLS